MNVNTQDGGAQTCGLQLLIKDHKGWSPESNTVPPSRPVVNGSEGLNMHLSELISKILEPFAEESGSYEVNSTGHMLHKIDELNKKLHKNEEPLEMESESKEDISDTLISKQNENVRRIFLQKDGVNCKGGNVVDGPTTRVNASNILSRCDDLRDEKIPVN